MLNQSLFSLSFDQIKELLYGLTILHMAVVYVLMYVIYKALGRYIYFKPQEHASKINRTFLTVSLLIVLIHSSNRFINYLPFSEEYRWFFALCALVIFLAPFRIIIDRIMWNYDRLGYRKSRSWHHSYLQIPRDYYKTSISKSEKTGESSYSTWEDEGVETTNDNISSDAFLDIIALIIFISVTCLWTYKSAYTYGDISYVFSITTCLAVSGLFINNAVFSWIYFVERKIRASFKS